MAFTIMTDQERLLGEKEGQKTVQAESSNLNLDGDVTEYVDNLLSSIGFGLFQVVAFILAGMTCIAYVCESLTLAFVAIEVTKLWNISNLVYASVPSLTCATNIVGEAIVSYVADHYGRKWPYVASLLIVGVFVAASAFAHSFPVFAVLRGIAAIGIGGTFVVKIPLLMEFLPKKSRGVVSISTGLIEALSQCAVVGLAWWLVPNYIKGWRYFILASSIPSLIVGVMILFFVESPRYLVAHNKPGKAWNVFSLVAFANGKNLTAIVKKDAFFNQVAKLNNSSKVSNSSKLRKLLVIFNRHYLRRTMCLGIIFAISNCVSYNTSLFLPYYLKALGFNPYSTMLAGTAAQVPGLALIAILIEWPKFGRRNTVRLFTALSVVFLLLFAFVRNEIATPVLTMLIYFSLVTSYGLLTTYISESYPTEIRVMVLAFLTFFVGLVGIWFPYASGYMTDLSKKHPWVSPTYLACAMIIQLIFTLLLNHETRGRNLDDVVYE